MNINVVNGWGSLVQCWAGLIYTRVHTDKPMPPALSTSNLHLQHWVSALPYWDRKWIEQWGHLFCWSVVWEECVAFGNMDASFCTYSWCLYWDRGSRI